MQITCVYKISSNSTGRFYVGSAKSFSLRKSGHLCDLRKKRHRSVFLQRHYDKYGIDDLNFEILEIVEDVNLLLQREQFYLDLLKPHFNSSPTAGNCLGMKMSDETKNKLRVLNTGDKNRFYGKSHSEESKRKMSEANKGKSAGSKNYFYGKNLNGNLNGMFGKNHSEQSKKVIKEKRKFQITTEETRLKMSVCRTGSKNHAAKAVICITNGIKYPTVTEAGKVLGVDRTSIAEVCRGQIIHIKGYKFKYA